MKPVTGASIAALISSPQETPTQPEKKRVLSLRLTDQQYREVLALTRLMSHVSGSTSISKAGAMFLEAGISATIQHLPPETFETYRVYLDTTTSDLLDQVARAEEN